VAKMVIPTCDHEKKINGQWQQEDTPERSVWPPGATRRQMRDCYGLQICNLLIASINLILVP
jgi:hypothetical protein